MTNEPIKIEIIEAIEKYLPREEREQLHFVRKYLNEALALIQNAEQSSHDRRKAIEDLRRETIEAIRNPSASNNTTILAFTKTVRNYSIPELEIHAFLDAVANQATKTSFRTNRDLLQHLRGFADAPANMILQIIGAKQEKEEARKKLHTLAQALQMISYLSESRQLAMRGTVTIPLDLLEKHGVSEEDFTQRKNNSGLIKAVRDYVITSRALLHDGVSGIKHLSKSSQFAFVVASGISATILEKIEDNDYNAFAKSTLGNVEKARLIATLRWRFKIRKQTPLQATKLAPH